tara:strand:- start:582 stop:959 length:378 start_codon:yes stop_codon:yes gene_type:complete
MLDHHHQEGRGSLSVLEYQDLKFQPKRMYYISGVPKGEIRGGHGHKKDEQYLICIKGKLEITTIDSNNNKTTSMIKEGEMYYIDKMIWGEQKYITGNEIILVLCSTNYDPDDYIYQLEKIIKSSI